MCSVFIYLPGCYPHSSYVFPLLSFLYCLFIYYHFLLMILWYLLPFSISAWIICYIGLSSELFHRYFKDNRPSSPLSLLSSSLLNLSLTLCLHLSSLYGTIFLPSIWTRHHWSYSQKFSSLLLLVHSQSSGILERKPLKKRLRCECSWHVREMVSSPVGQRKKGWTRKDEIRKGWLSTPIGLWAAVFCEANVCFDWLTLPQ